MTQFNKKTKGVLSILLIFVLVFLSFPAAVTAQEAVLWNIPDSSAFVGQEINLLQGVSVANREDVTIVVNNVTSTDKAYQWDGQDILITNTAAKYYVVYQAVQNTDDKVLAIYSRALDIKDSGTAGESSGMPAGGSVTANNNRVGSNASLTGGTNNVNPLSAANRTGDFQVDGLVIKLGGNTVYQYDGTNATVSYLDLEKSTNPRVEFTLDYSQVSPVQANFADGDYVIFDICQLSGSSAAYWDALSAEKALYDNGILLGYGSVLVETLPNGDIRLSLKISFTSAIAGMNNINGTVTAGSTITGMLPGDKVEIKVKDELVAGFEKINEPNTGGGTGSTLPPQVVIPDSKKIVVASSDSAKTITWRIYATEYAVQPFLDYANGTTTQYDDLIVEDILDHHQTFLSMQIRMPVFLYNASNPGSSTQGQFTLGSLHFPISSSTYLTDYTNDPTPEAAVRATPLSYAVITESAPSAPGFTRERLIMNLGAPESTGIRLHFPYGYLNGGVQEFLDDLWASYLDCKSVVDANPAAADTDQFTSASGVTATFAVWKRNMIQFQDSHAYYTVQSSGGTVWPYAYAYEIDITTKPLTGQSGTETVDKVKNAFSLTGGYTPRTGEFAFDNFWSAEINAQAALGDVQVFKADALYGNTAGDKADGSAVPGAMANVEFAVYRADGTGPLTFDYAAGKYEYDTGGSHNTVITGSEGSLIISGLPNGNYYLTEVAAPDGYYSSQNQQVDFTIDSTAIAYKLANNIPRMVKLIKVDSADNTVVLGAATFKLYRYTADDFSDAQELAGFTETIIAGSRYLIYDTAGADALTTAADGTLCVVQLPAGKYYLEETAAPTGYELSDKKYTFTLNDAYTGTPVLDLGNIENSVPQVVAETVEIMVTKVWQDANDKNNLRPSSVQVQLYKDGVAEGAPVQLNAGNNWTYTWTNLDKYDNNGKEITYTVQEVAVPNHYEAQYSSNTFTITNKLITDTVTPMPAVTPVPTNYNGGNGSGTRTGDSFLIFGLGAVLLISGAGIVWLLALRRKKTLKHARRKH